MMASAFVVFPLSQVYPHLVFLRLLGLAFLGILFSAGFVVITSYPPFDGYVVQGSRLRVGPDIGFFCIFRCIPISFPP